MLEFLKALINIDPAHLVVAALAVVAIYRMASCDSSEEEDDTSYEDASWNPSSVNYNG